MSSIRDKVRDVLTLVRQALTAAVLVAIMIRLRRRARMPRTEAPPPPPPAPPARVRLGKLGVTVALLVGVMGGLAAVGPHIAELTTAEARTETFGGETGGLSWGPGPHPIDDGRDAIFPQAMGVSEAIVPQAGDGSEVIVPQAADATYPPADSQTPSAVPQTPSAVPQTSSARTVDPSCTPARRPVTVRPIDQKVKRAVDRQWRRIERWLRSNAPRTYRALGAPGRAHTIAVAESQMGVDFPDDLRASLLRHNGSRGAAVFGFIQNGGTHLGIRDIRDSWRAMCSWERTDAGTDPRREEWNGRMIPFLRLTGRDSTTAYAVVNTAYAVVNSPDGTVGWDDETGGMAPRTGSFHTLLRSVADVLERDEIGYRRPMVKDGVLTWQVPG